MARGGYRNVFADGPAVRATDVDKAIVVPLDDDPSRKVKGERPKVDDFERVLLGLSSPQHWDCVRYLVDHVATYPKSGRPREHTVADWVLFWRASDITKSLRGTDDMFVRATNWLEAREVVRQMGWQHPQLQLSETEINRWQHDRFADRYVGPEQIVELRKLISKNAVGDARTLGLFPDSGGSKQTLSPKRVIYGDGSELKPMFNPRRRRVDPDTGEITYSRHDPEAIPHHHHKYVEDPYTGEVTCKICESNKKHGKKSKGGLDGALIHEMVALITRTDERQGRIILDIDLREEHETDANLFTQMFLDLRRNNNELQAMMLIALYDQRLNAVDFDTLQDDGIIVVRKVGNDPRGHIKIRVRHDQTFTLRDGSNIVHDVHIVDGTPALKVYDGNAIEWFVQLEREKIQVNELVNAKCIYTEWRVVDHPLVGTMAGAMVRLRHNSTKEEREKSCRRSVYMRVSPESCPDHPVIYPKREDSESHNATYKNRLDHARVRSVGRIRNRLNLLAFQMNENDKAMYAHFWRTGDEEGYDKRFTYRPERLAKPLLKAA